MTITPTPHTSAPADVGGADDSKTLRRSSIMLLAGAILLPIASQLHPTADTTLDFDTAVAGMLDDDAWYPAHLLELAATGLVLSALWQISRTPLVKNLRALRIAVLAAAAGTTIHLVDLVPHTFAATEVDELLAGGATPLLDAHLVTQAIATAVFGLSIAALAFLDARRSRRWTWIPAAIAVIGGLAGALAGPLLLITEDTKYGALFIGYAGIGIWLLVTAIRRLRAVRAKAEVALT